MRLGLFIFLSVYCSLGNATSMIEKLKNFLRTDDVSIPSERIDNFVYCIVADKSASKDKTFLINYQTKQQSLDSSHLLLKIDVATKPANYALYLLIQSMCAASPFCSNSDVQYMRSEKAKYDVYVSEEINKDNKMKVDRIVMYWSDGSYDTDLDGYMAITILKNCRAEIEI